MLSQLPRDALSKAKAGGQRVIEYLTTFVAGWLPRILVAAFRPDAHRGLHPERKAGAVRATGCEQKAYREWLR